MNHFRFKFLILYTAILFLTLPAMPSYSSNQNFGRIRGNASSQNDRIYNKIAIDLVNGRTNNISIDNMSRLLKNYNIVQFDHQLNQSARDMIIKEIAYRMIKNHYLPSLDDKIRVYRKSAELSKHAVPHTRQALPYPAAGQGYNVSLVLPVDYARIRENKTVDTLRWPEMSSQVSSAIENLWIGRIRSSSDDPARQQENMDIVEVLGELKFISDNDAGYNAQAASDIITKNVLYEAVEFIFTSWQLKGIIFEKDLPPLAAILRQYIILNSSDNLSNLAKDIKGLEDLNNLHNALIQSIYNISQNIKNNNPSDYATLAMLQAMLNDISDKISNISLSVDTIRSEAKPRFTKQ